MPKRTVEEIVADFHSLKKVCKRQRGVTVYGDKYVEDMEVLLKKLKIDTNPPKPKKKESKSEKEKAPKAG